MYMNIYRFICIKTGSNLNALQWVNGWTNCGVCIPWNAIQQRKETRGAWAALLLSPLHSTLGSVTSTSPFNKSVICLFLRKKQIKTNKWTIDTLSSNLDGLQEVTVSEESQSHKRLHTVWIHVYAFWKYNYRNGKQIRDFQGLMKGWDQGRSVCGFRRPAWAIPVLYLDCTNVPSLVVVQYYSFSRCYHWRTE